jgi:hypothetical protein
MGDKSSLIPQDPTRPRGSGSLSELAWGNLPSTGIRNPPIPLTILGDGMSTIATTHANGVDIIANASSIIEAEAAFKNQGIEILDMSSLMGDDFGDIVKKESLVGVSFLIVDVKFHKGEFGDYAAVLCMDNAGKRFVFTDGSTGIYRQLQDLSDRLDRESLGGIACRKGLKASEYEKDGRKAVTYYLA